MILLRNIAILVITFANCVLVFSDEAFDLFVEACRHSGYNPAEIVTFQAKFNVVATTVLPDSVIEEIAKSLSDAIEETEQEKEESLAAFKQSFSGEAQSSSIKVFVKNSAASIGLADTPTLILAEDQWLVEGQIRKELSLFSLGAEERTVATQIGQSKIITLNKEDHHLPIDHFLGGRIQSQMVFRAMKLLLSGSDKGSFVLSDAGIAAFKKDCEANGRTFTLLKERVKYEGDYSAYILEVYEKGELRERFWIDPDRGYICPKAQLLMPDGEIFGEILSEDFVLDEQSQKWFPAKVTDKSDVTMHSSEVRIVPGTLVINQPIPDSIFAIAVPRGTRVDDFRRDDNDQIAFFANQPSKLNLQTVEGKNLDELEWLTPRETHQLHEPYSFEKTTFSWLQIMLTVIGGILIVLGLILHFFKKYQ